MFPRSEEDWGGIFVFEQVAALRAIGVDARVLVGNPIWAHWRHQLRAARSWLKSRAKRSRPDWVDLRGVPVAFFGFPAPPMRLWARIAPLSFRWRAERAAVRRAAAFPFDIVHAHTALMDGSAAVRIADRFDVPFVLTEHTGPFTALTEHPANRRLTEASVNRADLILAVSDKLRRDIIGEVHVRHPERISVLGNGVDPAVFRPGAPAPIGDGPIRAIWIGGYVPVKQPLMLVEAFAKAATREPRLRLTMVGYGVLEDAVAKRIGELGMVDRVTMLPSASRAQVADHIRSHHFLVLSSETETFGMVVLEALACGRPVLTTRCGGPEETVGGKERGELVDNDCEALANGFLAMTRRLGDFDPSALASYAHTRFGYHRIAEQLVARYCELTHCKKRAR
jgi:glycosyltransferase involved in cell wall biosynthesis